MFNRNWQLWQVIKIFCRFIWNILRHYIFLYLCYCDWKMHSFFPVVLLFFKPIPSRYIENTRNIYIGNIFYCYEEHFRSHMKFYLRIRVVYLLNNFISSHVLPWVMDIGSLIHIYSVLLQNDNEKKYKYFVCLRFSMYKPLYVLEITWIFVIINMYIYSW